jgi:excisionase family DNA binding protein
MEINDRNSQVIFAMGEQKEFLDFLWKIVDNDDVIHYIIIPIIESGGRIPTASIDFVEICETHHISYTSIPNRIMTLWGIMTGKQMMLSATEEWVGSAKAAEYIHCSLRTTQALAQEGLLYARRDKGGKYRFNKGVLKWWLTRVGYPQPALRS